MYQIGDFFKSPSGELHYIHKLNKPDSIFSYNYPNTTYLLTGHYDQYKSEDELIMQGYVQVEPPKYEVYVKDEYWGVYEGLEWEIKDFIKRKYTHKNLFYDDIELCKFKTTKVYQTAE